jgi:hypothetical protein
MKHRGDVSPLWLEFFYLMSACIFFNLFQNFSLFFRWSTCMLISKFIGPTSVLAFAKNKALSFNSCRHISLLALATTLHYENHLYSCKVLVPGENTKSWQTAAFIFVHGAGHMFSQHKSRSIGGVMIIHIYVWVLQFFFPLRSDLNHISRGREPTKDIPSRQEQKVVPTNLTMHSNPIKSWVGSTYSPVWTTAQSIKINAIARWNYSLHAYMEDKLCSSTRIIVVGVALFSCADIPIQFVCLATSWLNCSELVGMLWAFQ